MDAHRHFLSIAASLDTLNTSDALPASASRPRRWWIHLALIGGYPLLVGLAGWGRNSALHQPALTHGTRGLLLVCTIELLVFSSVFGLAWLASRANKEDLLLRWRPGLWVLPIGIGYSVAIRIVLAIMLGVLGGLLVLTHLTTPEALQNFITNNRPDVEALVDVSALRHNPTYFWLTITFVSFVIGGLREELWRAAFLAGLRNLRPGRFGSRLGQYAAAALAAIVFGLGHMAMGPLAVCLTGLLGLGLGIIMIVHRSIWPAVIAHGMFDATSLALLPLVADSLPKIQ